MTTVWKTAISLSEMQNIELPEGAQFLHFDNVNEGAFAWWLVDTTRPTEIRRVGVVGTGHPIVPAPVMIHLGTAVFLGGSLIWHLFEWVDDEGVIAGFTNQYAN